MMNKIKLTYLITLSTFGGKQIGGAQVHVMHLINKIDLNRFEVSLIVGNRGILTESLEKLGVKIYISKFMKNPINPVKDTRAITEIKNILLQIQPDIIHTHSSKGGFLGRAAAHKAGVPVIIHTVQGFAFPSVTGVRKTLYLTAEKRAAKYTDKLICVSQKDKTLALDSGIITDPDKAVVIPNGFNDSFDWEKFEKIDLNEKYNISGSRMIFGMISRLDRQKNPVEFLKGIKIYLEKYKDLPAVFLQIGQGEKMEDCRTFIEENNLRDNVISGSWLNYPEYFNVLKSIDIMVLTSLWEGLPLAIIESMRIGTPVLASDIAGTIELIKDGETGILYQSGNPDDLANQIALIVEGKYDLEYIRREAKLFAIENFSYSKIAEVHMDLYNNLLNSKS